MGKNKKKAGQPTKYKPEYCSEIIEYFSIEPYEDRVMEAKKEFYKDGGEKSVFEKTVQVANPIRFISQFARHIGVGTSSLDRWANQHEEFREALKEAKELQKEHLITCGLKGLFNPSFSIFTAKNIIGWRDEQYLKGGGENGEFVVKVEISDSDEDKITQQSGNRISQYIEI